MAFTLGDIADKVRKRIKDSAYDTSETKDYINDTLNDIYNECYLRFMETSQNYTLVDGVSDITNGSGLPTDFVQAINLTLTTTGLETRLIPKDYREIELLYPDPLDTTVYPKNIPQYWYIYGDDIFVFPTPNSAYTVKLRYLKKPTLLSDDADVPELPSEFAEILVCGAAGRILQVKDMYDQAAIQQNKYDELLQKLVARYSVDQIGAATVMRINKNVMG